MNSVAPNIDKAPVKIWLYIPRELYEKAENVAKITGLATVDRLIIKLLEAIVSEFEEAGYDIRPFWEKE